MTETINAEPRRSSVPEPAGVRFGFDRVSYTYPNGGVQALSDLTLSITPGKSVAIVGPSGCGKSTLLALLTGLRTPTAGSVHPVDPVGGRHPMAMVFQKDTLLPWLTVMGNIKLFYKFHKADKKEVEERIQELIDLVSLRGFENAYPYQLSGGMRKRVAFLTAVAAQPSMLLLDEPFSSLDEPTRIDLHQDVLRITKQLDMTVVLVTHDLAEAATLSDEVVVLTNRPASVASVHTVPFGADRKVLALRQEPEFLQLYGELWSDLSEQIARSKAARS